MSQSPNRLLGIFLGVIYVIDGIYGFFLTSDTGFFATSGPRLLDLFETNPLHNLVHVVVGVALLTAALVGIRAAKATNTTLGTLFLLGALALAVMGHQGSSVVSGVAAPAAPAQQQQAAPALPMPAPSTTPAVPPASTPAPAPAK